MQKCSIMQKPYGDLKIFFYYYFMTFKHRNHSWSLVVIRGHSWSLLCTYRQYRFGDLWSELGNPGVGCEICIPDTPVWNSS
jgi:hypothetical protein